MRGFSRVEGECDEEERKREGGFLEFRFCLALLVHRGSLSVDPTFIAQLKNLACPLLARSSLSPFFNDRVKRSLRGSKRDDESTLGDVCGKAGAPRPSLRVAWPTLRDA